jgi:hypothetical protein
MSEVVGLARSSDWHSPKSAVAKCLFCGALGVWWDCRCEWSEKIRAGKLPLPTTIIGHGGPLVIEACPELLEAARKAGVIRVQSAPPRAESAPPSTESAPSSGQSAPVQIESAPPTARDEKRRKIIEALLADPDASDRTIAIAVGVNRRTVAAIRRELC